MIAAGVVIALGSIAILSFSSEPSAASFEPASGVRMEVPENWVIAWKSPGKHPIVSMVPEEHQDITEEVPPATIHVTPLEGQSCSAYENEITTTYNSVITFDIVDQELAESQGKYLTSDSFTQTTRANSYAYGDDISLHGQAEEWLVTNTYTGRGWASTSGEYVEYPNYLANARAMVCLDDFDLLVSLDVDATLFSEDAEKAANDGIFGPDENNSAYEYSSVVEVNGETKALYAEYFPAFENLLENSDTGSLLPATSNLGSLPSQLIGEYALSGNPFGSELEDPSYVADFTDEAQDVPEETTEDYEDSVPTEDESEETTYYESEPQMVVGGDTPEEQFVSEYFSYVNARDWASTYSLLDSDSQNIFSEEDWERLQKIREIESPTPPLVKATVERSETYGSGFIADVLLDTSEDDLSIPGFTVSEENGEYRRSLTDEDIVYLESLMDYENPSGTWAD